MAYIIGSGAILEAGERGSIAPAAVHARLADGPAKVVRAAAIDFEGTSPSSMRRLLVLVEGWDARRFRETVTSALLCKEEVALDEVLALLAQQAGVTDVHLFARWLPDELTRNALRERGITVIANPLECIAEAAIVAGERCRRWNGVHAA